MMGIYTIGQAARAAGVPASTLRYYEREGLIAPDGRTTGNYRYFTEDSLHRLHFIKAAQTAGFTIGDIKELLALQSGELGFCSEVGSLVEARLSVVEERIARLKHIQQVLEEFRAECRKSENNCACPVIDQLNKSSSPGSD